MYPTSRVKMKSQMVSPANIVAIVEGNAFAMRMNSEWKCIAQVY